MKHRHLSEPFLQTLASAAVTPGIWQSNLSSITTLIGLGDRKILFCMIAEVAKHDLYLLDVLVEPIQFKRLLKHSYFYSNFQASSN